MVKWFELGLGCPGGWRGWRLKGLKGLETAETGKMILQKAQDLDGF